MSHQSSSGGTNEPIGTRLRMARWRFGVTIVCACIFLAFLFLNHQRHVYDSTVTLNEQLPGEKPENSIFTTIYLSLKLPSWSDKDPTVKVTLDKVVFYVSGNIDADKICFGELAVFNKSIATEGERFLSNQTDTLASGTKEHSCANVVAAPGKSYAAPDLTRLDVDTRTFTVLDTRYDSYIYPFDKFDSTLSFKAVYEFFSHNKWISNVTDAPTILVTIPNEPNWDSRILQDGLAEGPKLEFSDLSNGTFSLVINQDQTEQSWSGISLSIYRPIIYRVSVTVFVLVVIIMTAFMNYIETTDAFLQVSAALFFGIFAVTSIVIPREAANKTVMDTIVLGLYLLLSLTILFHLWSRLVTGRLALSFPQFHLPRFKFRSRVQSSPLKSHKQVQNAPTQQPHTQEPPTAERSRSDTRKARKRS